MRNDVVVKRHCISLSPKSYTWNVRKQINCYGACEYMVEIIDLPGCVSYGDTLAEAKKGLEEAVQLWFKHNKRSKKQAKNNDRAHMIIVEPKMTNDEFDELNKRLLHILLN